MRDRKAQERLAAASVPPREPPQPPPEDRKSIRAWHISLGIPAAFVAIGIGLAVAGGIYFWPGIYLATAGVLWLLADWGIFSKKLSRLTRLTGTIGTLVIGLVIAWMAFRPAPLGIFSIAEDANYPAGTKIYGIKSNDLYYDVRTLITNESDGSYSDLEIFIRTDLTIREVGFNSRVNCSNKVWSPFSIAGQALTGIDEQGEKITIPITGPSFGTVFRIYCDKLLAHETIEIVSAIIGGGQTRTKPSWVTVTANYSTFGRPETKDFAKCLIGTCLNMLPPTKF